MEKPYWLILLCALVAMVSFGAAPEENDDFATSAKAAALIECSTGKVLFAQNESAPLPMASTTKVMTALLTVEHGYLDETVTVGRNAFGVPGTSIYLEEGEQITLRNLLYGLMLASGNDAAVAIAEHIGGDVDTFCGMMTARARELGCEATTFVNPNGLPVAGHKTTALELAKIAREAMTHEVFREVVSTQRASIPWQNRTYDRILHNKNRLLSEYVGATGIKTGYTKAAGRCLVFGAERNGMEVVGVVLNCPDWFEEAKRVMDYGFAHYERVTAFTSGETVRVLPVENGQEELAYLQLGSDLSAIVPKGELPSLEFDLPERLQAGFSEGEPVGEARLTANGETLAAVPIVASSAVAQRDYAFEIEQIMDNWTAFHTIAN